MIYTGGEGSNPTPSFTPGDTTVNVTIAGAKVVACTFTNIRRGSIRVVKNSHGGDALFDFTGARHSRSSPMAAPARTLRRSLPFAGDVSGRGDDTRRLAPHRTHLFKRK